MNKKTLIGIVIGVLLLGVIGFSYSFFTTSIIGTGQENTVTAGTLELQYIDGPGISLSKAYPGQSITKVVSVKNIGTLDAEYDLIFKDLVNEIEKDELLVSYTCTSYKDYVDSNNKGTVSGTCNNLTNQVVPFSETIIDSTISTNITIAKDITHEYTFTITFKEINNNQNYNQGKHFSAKINATQVNNSDLTTQYVEKQLFTDIENATTTSNISDMRAVVLSAGPYSYQNSDIFSGKTISKIGIPVKSVSDVNTPQTFTVYVVDKEPLSNLSSMTATTIAKTYELTLPSEQLGDSTTVNKMVYVDVNIPLADNQTLAFGSEDDTVIWGYIRYNETIVGNQYRFIAGVLTTPATNNGNIIFDIYEKEEVEIETPGDETESPLKTALTGKNFSILGDSISTFEGYSNNATTTNNTIGSNNVYYPYESPVTDVNMTWWMQAANETGMNVLVNNSWSGDTIANRGITRAMQLHDNTGENSGTNPDIIAVYIGVNDVKNTANLSTTIFSENYTQMITNIKTTYSDADVFVFTLLPYTAPSATVPSMGAEEIEVYNEVIRTVASANDCTVVDLFNDSGITEDNYLSDYMWDTGLHPNQIGMDAIAETFINALSEKYLN